jgi:hypothetical protein
LAEQDDHQGASHSLLGRLIATKTQVAARHHQSILLWDHACRRWGQSDTRCTEDLFDSAALAVAECRLLLCRRVYEESACNSHLSSPGCRSDWAPSAKVGVLQQRRPSRSKHPKHAHAPRKPPHLNGVHLGSSNAHRQVYNRGSFGGPDIASMQLSSRTHSALARPCLSPHVFGSSTEAARRLVGDT